MRGRLIAMVVALVICTILFLGFRFMESEAESQFDIRDVFVQLINEEISSCRGATVSVASERSAYEMLETWIVPTLENKDASRIEMLKRRISDGKAWMYTAENERYRICLFQNLYPENDESGRFGFAGLSSCFDKVTGKFDPDCENPLFLTLVAVARGPRLELTYTYSEELRRIPRIRRGAAETDQADIIVVADVVDVQLVSVNGYDRAMQYAEMTDGCCAVYHVRLDIRKVEQGKINSNTLILEEQVRWLNDSFSYGGWLNYRGMTLRLALQKKKMDYLCVKEEPVLPYEPFSGENVKVSGGRWVYGVDGSCLHEGKLSPLVIEYGDHTKVEYSSGKAICKGKYSTFLDFGVSSCAKVLTVGEEADKVFWENAWFLRSK